MKMTTGHFLNLFIDYRFLLGYICLIRKKKSLSLLNSPDYDLSGWPQAGLFLRCTRYYLTHQRVKETLRKESTRMERSQKTSFTLMTVDVLLEPRLATLVERCHKGFLGFILSTVKSTIKRINLDHVKPLNLTIEVEPVIKLIIGGLKPMLSRRIATKNAFLGIVKVLDP